MDKTYKKKQPHLLHAAQKNVKRERIQFNDLMFLFQDFNREKKYI